VNVSQLKDHLQTCLLQPVRCDGCHSLYYRQDENKHFTENVKTHFLAMQSELLASQKVKQLEIGQLSVSFSLPLWFLFDPFAVNFSGDHMLSI
jgi:hypothetical protein